MSTICSVCGQQNPEGSKFCGACGVPLATTCPDCGSTVGPGMRFCNQCGTSVGPRAVGLPSSSPCAMATAPPSQTAGEPEGERKQLTVLFADVQGSMEIQEDLDLEAWARIMDRFVDILDEGVRRFGGTVDKFTGDGIMALFGAPEAQEDHARRACHAAWHMSRAIRAYADELRQSDGVDLLVRIGVNSGEVVVGQLGDGLRFDAVAHGHTVGLAQRMEALAVPGSVYLTERTARLVEGWFRLRDLGPMTVKGAREPLGVFVLEGPAPPRSTSSGKRTTSRLVGRAAETAILEDALTRAAEGQAQVVGVVGEPGVGKSRLCDEFARSVLARGIIVRRAAGVSHGREVPLLPILAFLRDYFGITEGDVPGQARERISDRLLGLDASFLADLPLFFDLLEVPDPERPVPQMGAEVRMQRIFEAIRRLTARRSERELLVLVFEDLHWFDPQSATFLERLIENFPGSRTLVVTNFRPEFSAVWMRHSYYRQIALLPLSAEAVGEMLRELLGDDASLAPLPGYLVERTGGNPFFVEEVVRALAEDGTLEGRPGAYHLSRPLEVAGLPASVQSVLAARIDRLAAKHKPVLQSAAVIGRIFAEAVLARVMGQAVEVVADSLSALCSAELLQEVKRYPLAEYRFWHALTQEVAYGTLLGPRRARLHAAVAEALIELDADRLDEEAALVAWHWERAGRRLEAAQWGFRAGGFALRSDIGEALRRWRAAVDLLEGVEETPEALELGARARMRLIQYGAREGRPAQELARYEAEGMKLADRLGDRRLGAMMLGFSGSVRVWAGELQDGLARYRNAAHVADETEDLDQQAAWPLAAGIPLTFVGPLAEGLSYVERTLLRCAGNPERGVALLGYSLLSAGHPIRATLLARIGRLSDAQAAVEQALSVVRPRGEREWLCWTLAILPLLAWLSGEGGDTSASAQEAVRLAQETGNAASLVIGLEAIAVAHLVVGQPDEAAAACERALTVSREKRSGLHVEASVLAHLAQARLAAGDLVAAASAADEAVDVAHREGARVHECLALLTRAQVGRSSGGDTEAVDGDLDAALQLVGEIGALTYEPFIREELGRLHGDEGELREALRLYGAIGATGHARRLEAELGGRVPIASSSPGEESHHEGAERPGPDPLGGGARRL